MTEDLNEKLQKMAKEAVETASLKPRVEAIIQGIWLNTNMDNIENVNELKKDYQKLRKIMVRKGISNVEIEAYDLQIKENSELMYKGSNL